jgi:drug/metabolite transporter (DMT)-like permease
MFSAFALLGVVGYHVGLNIGEKTVTAATASFLVAQIPLVTLLLHSLLFRERITAWGAAGLATGVSGTGLILFGEADGLSIDFGVLWIVMAITSESLFFIYQKPALDRFTPFGLNLYTSLFATAFMAPFLFYLTVPGAQFDISAIGVILYLGIFPAAVAYLLWSYAIATIGVARAATTLYALPGITIIMGFVLIGELPTMLAISGGLLALLGAYLCGLGVRIPRKTDFRG